MFRHTIAWLLLAFIAICAVWPLGRSSDSELVTADAATGLKPVKVPQQAGTFPWQPVPPSSDINHLEGSSWYNTAISGIMDSEYEIKPDPRTHRYACPNRKNGFRSFISPDRLTLQQRKDSAEHWKLDLNVKGIFEGGQQLLVLDAQAGATTDGKRIRFEHQSGVVTEYINNEDGIRQNFIIRKELASHPRQLSVKMVAGDGWVINKVADKELHFAKVGHKTGQTRVTYNSLKAWDANNKELASAFEVHGNEVCINVATAGATYPVTIDPLSSNTVDNTPDDANQAGAAFGTSVASAGDVNGDGYSDVIIGAPNFDDGTTANVGRAFVYHGSATGLSSTPNNTPHGATGAGDAFGFSVSTAGDVNKDGYSDVVIGAPLEDYSSSFQNVGQAYLYYGSATGLGTTYNKKLATAVQGGEQFGRSVACAGDINGDGYADVVVGKPHFSAPPGFFTSAIPDAGAVEVFLGGSGGLSNQSTTMTGFDYSSGFGMSAAGAGDINGDGYGDIVVGAPSYDVQNFFNTYSDVGMVFVYYGSSSGINISAGFIYSDVDVAGRDLGQSVATAGDVNKDGYSDIVVGIPGDDNGKGATRIYFGSSGGIQYLSASQYTSFTTIPGTQAGANQGYSVACAGDVNGDGFSDVITGAPYFDNGSTTDVGQAVIYLGKSGGITTTPEYTLSGTTQSGAYLGRSLASAGDINGDGFSDVILGADGFDDGSNTDEGRAFVYHGGPAGISDTVSRTLSDASQSGAQYGFSVSGAGDVNGDGFADVIIGAPFYDDGANLDEGRAFVYHGSSSGLSATPNKQLDDANLAFARLGSSVACAGDVNGDGYSDVIVGAPNYTQGANAAEGMALIYHGSSGGLSTTPAAMADDANQANAHFGTSVASAGDVNGDGYSDVTIGAPDYDDGTNTDEGRAFVYYGSATGISSSPNSTTQLVKSPEIFFGDFFFAPNPL